MAEKQASSTSSSSSLQGRSRSGGGKVKKVPDKRQRSSDAVPFGIDDEEGKMAWLAQAVSSNALITSRIWPHLNFADLKVAREVSWDFFKRISRFRGFKNYAILKVTKDSVQTPDLFDKNTSMTETWHGVEIEVDLPLDVVDKIRHILEHVQFISIVTSRPTPEDAEFRHETFATFIGDVLSSTPKLLCLQIDIRFLQNDLREVWTSPIIRDHLKNLESLELPHLCREHHMKVLGTHLGNSEPYYVRSTHSDDFSSRNIEQLSQIETPRLKTLRVTKYLVESFEGPLTRTFFELLRSHGESLVEVSIPVIFWEASDDIRTMTLPHLKSLTTIVTCSVGVTKKFKRFLMNHPSLEVLDLYFADTVHLHSEIHYWQAIERGIASCANLKKVHLKIPRIFWTMFGIMDLLDWTFLEEMKHLKDFKVEVFRYWTETRKGRNAYPIPPDDAGGLLNCLPKNQLERLSLKGIRLWVTRGSFLRCLSEDSTRNVTEAPLTTKLEVLRGFRNLKHLSFRHCPNAVDDEVLRFILKEMTSLEEFEVSHCSRLTDAGIAGTGPEEEEKEEERVSIQSLKELKLLSIRACPSVTPEGLLSVLALPFLQHFDYFTKNPVPKSFVHGIAAQNPSLETISVHITTDSNDPGPNNPVDIDNGPWSSEEKKDFFKKHPRIKALNNLEKLGREHEYASNDLDY